MRLAALLFIGSLGLALTPVAAQALPTGAVGSTSGQSANVIEAAVRCGPHAHYIRGHRTKHGYVKGRCVRNRHR